MRSITFLRKLKENKRFLTLFPLPRERIGVIFITQNAKDMVGMDYKEALEYINRTEWFGSRPGLERITELLEKLGNPQNGMKFVHIAGTNGKGSCAAMTASVLKAAGYKTGLFTSPYLYRFNERHADKRQADRRRCTRGGCVAREDRGPTRWPITLRSLSL